MTTNLTKLRIALLCRRFIVWQCFKCRSPAVTPGMYKPLCLKHLRAWVKDQNPELPRDLSKMGTEQTGRTAIASLILGGTCEWHDDDPPDNY